MRSMELLMAIGQVRDDYIQDILLPMEEAKACQKRSFPRTLLVAAVIGLLLLLVGCAAYFHSLNHLVVVDHTEKKASAMEAGGQETNPEETAEEVPELPQSPVVAEKVLSIQGYEGSPAYHALQEWLTFAADYTAGHPQLRFSDDFQRPEAYTSYPCYSQEMVDKVDEICSKYELHLLGKSIFLQNEHEMADHGLLGVLSEGTEPRCFYGHLYPDGSFEASGELTLSGDYEKTVQFQMHNIKKDAFYTVHLGLNNMSAYTQWNYTTRDGYTALLALNDNTGLIFAENEGRFLSVIVEEVPEPGMIFTGLPGEKQFLEQVCDCFVYADFMKD